MKGWISAVSGVSVVAAAGKVDGRTRDKPATEPLSGERDLGGLVAKKLNMGDQGAVVAESQQDAGLHQQGHHQQR